MAPAFILLILITLSYGKREFCHQYCNCSDTSRLKFISCDSSKYNTTEIQSFVDKNGFHIVKFINSSLTHVQLKSDSLLTLQLNSNNLSSRYVSINCKNLKHLYLGDNYLDKGIFTCLENLTSLMELDLSENSIKVIDNQILINSPNLEVINLEGNYIQIIRRNYFNVRTNLIKLNLKKNKLKHIDKFSFVKLSSLQELYLDENIFSTLTKNIFSGLASLRILSISKCNRLRKIEPSTFHNLIGLQNMNLSFNKNLKNLPRRLLHDSKDLSVMDIQTSSLSSLSYDIVDQTCCSNSTKLIISGNFLRCDCRLRWMKVKKKISRLRIIDDNLVCATPKKYAGKFIKDLDIKNFKCKRMKRSIRDIVEYVLMGLLAISLVIVISLIGFWIFQRYKFIKNSQPKGYNNIRI